MKIPQGASLIGGLIVGGVIAKTDGLNIAASLKASPLVQLETQLSQSVRKLFEHFVYRF
jgi:hypothetical protein